MKRVGGIKKLKIIKNTPKNRICNRSRLICKFNEKLLTEPGALIHGDVEFFG